MDKSFKVAAVSAEGFAGPIEKNLQILAKFSKQLRDREIRLALFPEGFLTGYGNDVRGCSFGRENALALDSPEVKKAVEIIRKTGVYISVGLWEDIGYPVITQLLVGPEGLLGRYQKVHPAEGNGRKGSNLEVVDLGFCRVGTQICKDTGYSETSRVLVLKGANVLLRAIGGGYASNPNKIHPGIVNNYPMARERARENYCYFIQTNWSGSFRSAWDDKIKYFPGFASICSPEEILVKTKLDSKPNKIITAKISPDKYLFNRIFCFQTRSPHVYSQISSKPAFETFALPLKGNEFFFKWLISPCFPIHLETGDGKYQADDFRKPFIEEESGSKLGIQSSFDWKTHYANSIIVDLYEVHGLRPYQTTYLLTEFQCQTECRRVLNVKGAELIDAWLNGQKIISADLKNIMTNPEIIIPIKLKKGKNLFLFKCANLDTSFWGVCAWLSKPG